MNTGATDAHNSFVSHALTLKVTNLHIIYIAMGYCSKVSLTLLQVSHLVLIQIDSTTDLKDLI